jgi:two-component system OmpR family response regulator
LSAESESPYILVIDDEQTICEVVDMILVDEGYKVRSAGTISAALRLVQERQPDLILLDLTLPGPGGEGFVAAYRQLPNATASIVVMSGRVDVEQRVTTIGANGVLAKPFEIDALIQTVRAMLADRGVDFDAGPDGAFVPLADDPADLVCRGS